MPQPTRQLEFDDAELGLIALAVELLADNPDACLTLSLTDRDVLKSLRSRSAAW